MGNYDVLKQYKVQIGADTTEFLKELNKLETEANKKLKDLNLSEGLRNDVEKLVQEISVMKKSLGNATDEVKTISSSISDLSGKIEELQGAIALLTPDSIGKSTKEMSDSFNKLSDNITEIIGKFKAVSEAIQKIHEGKIDISAFDGMSDGIKDATKEVKKDTKDLKKYLNDLYKFASNNKIGFVDRDSLKKQSKATITEFRSLIDTIEQEAKSLGNSAEVKSIISNKLGIGITDLKSLKSDSTEIIKKFNDEIVDGMPKEIHSEVRFKINLDEDVEGTATVESIVRKVNEVVDKAQKKVKGINIPIGYTTDISNIKDQKELDDIAGKDTDKVLFKKLNLEVKANTDNLVNNINSEVSRVNEKLKESGRKIEVEVIGKVNPNTIEDSAKDIAYEIEDAQYKLRNNVNVNGGNLSIDPSSGIATETTLSEIKTILSQWNATGIPGTQSEEFKQQLKNKADNKVIASDFDKYFRRYSYKPTKRQNDINNTTDFLESTLNMRLDKKEALKTLKRNRNLKKGGEEGLAALKGSDYYNKSKIIDGVEYTQFETGTKLKDWQAKLEKLYKESFDEAGKIIGGLFNVTREVEGKTPKGNQKKTTIKGYLQNQIDKVDRDNKATRESLNLNKLQHEKDKYGKYTSKIVYEHGTVTSTEDAYAKTKSIVDRIKADAESEYLIQEAKTKELIEQRSLMQQIYDLEQGQKVSPLSQEDNELLTSLKNDLSSRIKVISDQDKYDKLVAEQDILQEKGINGGLTSPEYNRLKEVKTEIKGLFKDVDDLSKYVVQQMATDAETGLSFIDQRIEESNKAAKAIIKTAQQNIGQVFNPVDDGASKIGISKGSFVAEDIAGNDLRLTQHKATVQVKSQAQYDYYEKEIEKLQARNGYLSSLVAQDKNGKNDYSAMTDAEKAEYFSNQKYIQALKARNLVYAEQNNLESRLIGNKDAIIDKEKATIKSLHVADSEKKDYERLYAEMHNTEVDERLYLSSLSDEEFDKAIAAFERVNKAIDDQAKLSSEEVKALVRARIDEDIAYLRKSLEQEEAELIKMEKNPSRYSQKQKDNKQYRINRIINSIEQLENPNSESRSNARILAEKREDLSKNRAEQSAIVQTLKESLGITEKQIALAKELFEINKNIADTKEEIKQKDRELSTSVIVPETTNKKGEITSSHADALKNSRTILSTELKELEYRKEEIETMLSSSANANSLKQLGVIPLSSEEEVNIAKQSVSYTKKAVEMLAQKSGLNKENIADLERVLVLEAQIYQEEMKSKDARKIVDDPLFDHPLKVKSKKNNKFVEQIPQSEQAQLEAALLKVEKSDKRIEGFNKEKQEAIDRLVPTIMSKVKEEIQNKIKSLQTKIDQGDVSATTKFKKDELEEILKSTTAIQDLVQQRIHFIFESVEEVRKVIEAQMPKDGTQIDFGLLSKDSLTQLFDLLEKEEILSDEIYQILARVNGSGALGGKHFRANSGMGDAKFDPFDTTYDPRNIYAERSALYEYQIRNSGSASVDTARKHLELAKEVAIEREKEKQRAIEIHEAEKKIVAERQKELRLTNKAYESQYISPFGFNDEENITDGSIGEARSKVNEISQEIKLLQEDKGKLDNSIQNISQNSEREFLVLAEREKKIAEDQQNRLNKIANLQNQLEKERFLKRKDGETDEDYQSRVSQFQEKQQKERLQIEEQLKDLRRKNTDQLKAEKKELTEIAKHRKNLALKYGDSTGLSYDWLINNTTLSYAEYEQIKNKYDSARSRLGDYDDDVIALGKELKEARDKYVSEAAKYFSSGTVDDIDEKLSQKISELRAEEKAKNKDKPKDIYLDSEKSIEEAQKKRLDNIKRIQEEIYEASKFSVDSLTRNDGEKKKDFELRKQNAQKHNQEELVRLQEKLNNKQLEHNDLLELEERRLLQLRFEKQSQLKLDEQTADLRKQRDDVSQEISNAEARKKAAELEVNAQIRAREEAEKRLVVNKEIKKFQTGMNIDQKKASLGVDLELIKIQNLQEELSKTPVGTNQYKELERQIVEAKRELSLFRTEAETLGLTLSQTTGRMFLNSDTGLTGLSYNVLFKNVDTSKLKSNDATYVPSKEDIARQKEMSKEQVKAYHYHSDMVDVIKLEANEKKRLWKMSFIGNMTDEQAKVTLEIQKTVASVKNWNKATEEEKNKLKALHDEPKSLGLEIHDKGKSKNYVKQLVSTKDFKLNPEQYATNKYLKQMLSSPTGSYSKHSNLTNITNLRGATESTLQNIQKILMTGVKVKLIGKDAKIDYKNKLNKSPDVNGDNDPYEYLLKQQEKNKNKKPFIYDATKKRNYDKMLPEQQELMRKWADAKNRLYKDGKKDATVAKELKDIYKQAGGLNLSVSKKGNLYLKDDDVGKKIKVVKKETDAIKENTKAVEDNKKAKRERGVFGDGTKDINSDLSVARKQLNRKNISEDTRKKWEDIQKVAIAEAEKRGYSKDDKGFYVDENKDKSSKIDSRLEETQKKSIETTEVVRSEVKEQSEIIDGNVAENAGKSVVDLANMPKEWIKLYLDGVEASTPEMEQAFKNIALIPEEILRSVLEISSPSKVMEQLGYWTVNGFTKGIKDNSDDIKNALIQAFTDAKISQSDLTNWLGLDETKSLIGKQGNNAVYKAIKDISSNNLLPNSYKDENVLSLNQAKQFVKDADIKVDAEELKTLGEKVGNKWRISKDAIIEYIEKQKTAVELQEKLNDSTDEYKIIQEIAYENGLSGALDIIKNTSIKRNKNGKETNVLYNVKDAYGNSAVINDYGKIESKEIKKSREIISKEATELKKLMSQVSNTLSNSAVQEISSYMDELLPDGEKEKVDELRKAYLSLLDVLEFFENGKSDFTKDDLDFIKNQINTINSIKSSFTGEAISLGKIDISSPKELQSTLKGLAQELENASVHNIKFTKNNKEMTYQIIDADNMLNTYRLTVQKTGEVTKELISSEKRLNTFQKLVSATGKKFGEIFNYMVASTSIYEIFNFFRRGITIVQEFDAAMTELYKVSKDTTEALNKFGKEAYDIAKKVGSTGVEIINSAADWTKLGYSIEEASELAKNSNIYANVGDMDIDTATEHMVSSVKAWGSEFNNDVEASSAIVDRYNEIGNNFAITSADIGSAMERSAAALKAGGNTLNEALGLITAGNIIQQDAETTAHALKTMSLRIRGAKADLEEMGEETDGLASSTSKMRNEIKALTGVDIMLDENNFKSTAKIIQELGAVWENMSDVSQAATLEKLAGKTRASTIAGLLENYETIEKVINSAEKAAGSAEKENERYLESIQGHLDILTNQWQSIWTSEITRDIINTFIDIGTWILKLVDNFGLLKSAVAGVTGIFAAKKIFNNKNDNSGGRDKKFSLVIKYATESFSREVCEF